MELKVNGEYQDVDFWSFMKCHVIAQISILGVYLLILFLIGVFIA